MRVIATDSFTGTDGVSLPTYSADWAKPSGTWDNLFIRSNQAGVEDPPNIEVCAAKHAVSLVDDQYTQALLVARPNSVWVVRCRQASAANTYYGGGFDGNHWGLNDMTFKVVGGTFTILEDLTQTFVATDTVKLEVEGSSVKLFRNGTLRGSGITDTAITSGGSAIELSHSTGGTVAYLDDWETGDSSVAFPPERTHRPHPISQQYDSEDEGHFNELDVRNWYRMACGLMVPT